MDLRAVRVLEGTKISHDYKGNDVTTFSYRDLIERGVPAIGIPCKQNNLLVIDIDVAGESHKQDGREWWSNFVNTHGIPPTYTVQTRSGGYHFYFRLPEVVNPETFSPPGQLAPGVDIKWRGWVGAPPTAGYSVLYGDIGKICEAPPSLMMEISNLIHTGKVREFDRDGHYTDILNLHRGFTAEQIGSLYKQIEWMQSRATLSRDEWRDGLFSLKAGCEDPKVMEELALKWTFNKSYSPGDEHSAIDILERADKHGPVGPGTIFGIIKNVAARVNAITKTGRFWDRVDVIERSKVTTKFDKNMRPQVIASESNAAAVLGTMYPCDQLYHDIRQDQFMFKGQPISDVDLLNLVTPEVQSLEHGVDIDIKMGVIASGLDILLAVRKVDPHLHWLNSIQWDGKNRLEHFFTTYVGAEDSEYMRAVGKNFWISLAARGLNPGCKVDSMVILEGHEGIRKSALVQAIGGDYTFTPSTTRLMDEIDDLRKMHQSIIVELPELMGLIGQDANKVKAFLSKPFDHIRGLFSKKAMKLHRGFIFVGTTNNAKYLSADMGVRRFWPVVIPKAVKTINLEAIKTDREQLFAEAVVRFKNNEAFHEVPSQSHKHVVGATQLSEPLLGAIDDITFSLGHEFRTSEVYTRLSMGGFISTGLSSHVAKRIEIALVTLGAVEYEADRGMVWSRVKEPDLSNFF